MPAESWRLNSLVTCITKESSTTRITERIRTIALKPAQLIATCPQTPISGFTFITGTTMLRFPSFMELFILSKPQGTPRFYHINYPVTAPLKGTYLLINYLKFQLCLESNWTLATDAAFDHPISSSNILGGVSIFWLPVASIRCV